MHRSDTRAALPSAGGFYDMLGRRSSKDRFRLLEAEKAKAIVRAAQVAASDETGVRIEVEAMWTLPLAHEDGARPPE